MGGELGCDVDDKSSDSNAEKNKIFAELGGFGFHNLCETVSYIKKNKALEVNSGDPIVAAAMNFCRLYCPNKNSNKCI